MIGDYMKSVYKDYVPKITTATPLQLVNITFELIQYHIDYAQQQEVTSLEFTQAIDKSKQFLDSLIISLDMEYPLSSELLPVYLMASQSLINAKLTLNKSHLTDATNILTPIAEAFIDISEDDDSEATMDTSKIYAGLTYGKGGLNEYIDDENGRNFEA